MYDQGLLGQLDSEIKKQLDPIRREKYSMFRFLTPGEDGCFTSCPLGMLLNVGMRVLDILEKYIFAIF